MPIKNFAEGAVHDLLRRIASDRRTILHQYDRLEQCSERVIEVDICGAWRILADYTNNSLILLDLGNHEVVPRYNDRKRDLDLSSATPAPKVFYSSTASNFFKRNPDRTVTVAYAEETTDDWLYFLTDEQQYVLDCIENRLLDKDECSSMIVGGPGTGKTCILLNLLHDLSEDYEVGIHISDALAEYIERITGANISKYRSSCYDETPLDLLLVDDPTLDELKSAVRLKEEGFLKSVVLGFDPLQLDQPLSDAEFHKIKYDGDLEPFYLKDCYRQKANLGANTVHVVNTIAESTPFLASDKIEAHKSKFEKMTELSNDLNFPNPAGYLEIYPEATAFDVTKEILRLMANSGFMSRKNGLLVVSEGIQLSHERAEIMDVIEKIPYAKKVDLTSVRAIKGLEFEHVFVFVTRGLFAQIQNGFSGSGQAEYNKRRLLRIPFSRAKDSLVTFAF
ncbi:MAG: hypothetical protein ABI878_00925 [Acidobacteriota bacterium]